MMPLPQLLDGLGRERLEVVQKAFNLHRGAFRSDFLKYLPGGTTDITEGHVARMAILFETIMNHSIKCDKSSTFGQNFLKLSIDHIKALQQELNSVKMLANSPTIQQKKAVLELLNFHLNHLERLMEKMPIHPAAPVSAAGKIVTMAHVHVSSTSNVLMNTLSSKSDEDMVRHALLSEDAVQCAQKILLSRGERNTAQVKDFFQSIADIYVKELLQKRQMDTVKDVIRNSDRDIWTTLKSLWQDTIDSNIRDYLALELNSVDHLEPLEIDAWKFLILIEGIMKSVNLGINIVDGSLRIVKPVNSGNQLDLSIASLLTLPSSSRVSFLTELYFETFHGTLEPMINKDDCWKYLLASDQLEILIKWIHAVNSKTTSESEKPDRVTTFLSSWDITQEMIDYISKSMCSPATRECVLDCLSQFGSHLSEETCNVHKLLSRAIHTSQIFTGMDARIERLLIEFCEQHNMPDLLVSCDIKTNCQTTSWLELYTSHQAFKDNSNVKRSLCASLEHSADYLKIPKSANQWISLTPFLLLEQTLHETSADVEDGMLQEILANYPQFSSLSTNNMNEDMKPIDLSLLLLLKQKFFSETCYQVLKEQSLCSMFKEESGENNLDFSHGPSILTYGHNETLDFQYFLRQGRPCHAAMLVLSEVIRNFGKPSRKLLKRAVLSAHELAFRNTTNQTVTSSCIAFIEMLGETSITLRTHLATVNQIMSFKSNGDYNHRIDTHRIPFQLVAERGTLDPPEVFELLLSSLPLNIHMQGLAVQFANLHKLPLHRNFLEHCAFNNDWINFLLFCQIYYYPPDIVKHAASQFKSSALVEHFEVFLQRYEAPKRTASKPNLESARKKGSTRSSTSEAPCSKDLDQTATTPSEGGPPVFSCVKESVFGVLFACHNCGDPVEALLHACIEMPCPILAVLADFYQAKAEPQLVAWLASWLPQEERLHFECMQKNAPWPPEVIESIVLRSLETSHSNLHTGFKIFTPDHPLVLVLEIVAEFSRKELLESVQALLMFKESSLKLRKNEINSGVSWCLDDASFVFNIGTKMLFKSLQNLPLANDKKKLLQIFCEANMSFSPDGASIDQSKQLLAILNVLSSTNVVIDVDNFFKNSSEEIHRQTEKLIALGLYKEATGISDETFVVFEQTYKLKKWHDTNCQDFRTFCTDCNSCFEEAMVDPMSAFNFFRVSALDLKRSIDRWKALNCALSWLKRAISNCPHNNLSAQVDELEMEMWKCCIHENDRTIFSVLAEELQHSALSVMCTKELAIGSFTFTEVFHLCDILCEEQPCPSKLINCLLDIGDILSASRVQNLFQSNHKDLEILESCISLAEEKLKVQEIPTHWVLFPALKFQDTSNQELVENSYGQKLESNISSENSGSMQSSIAKFKVLSVIQELCRQLRHGQEIGKQLIACFRLAINLDLPYKDIICITDPLKLLRAAISQSYCADHSIASDVMVALRMSAAERAKFLSREIIAAISKGTSDSDVKAVLLWSNDLDQYFPHLLELVLDPSLLGNELMNMISNLSFSDKNTPNAVLYTATEMLVRAHDCYVAGCHIEGISQVLRTVTSFTPILKSRSEWALMARLLTGIQRYTEMNYIFKALKDSDHFEFLLRKDPIKPLGFKLALLDWLRRECADNTGLLKIAAAHFQMHKQEAALWQTEGNDRLLSLVNQGLFDNQKTKQGLQTVLEDYSHASECYLQANMVNHAMASAHQAELVALQLHLLSSPSEGSILRVTLLDSKSVAKLLVSTLSFNQALIVARAYNHRTDWAAALFYHCISPGLSTEEYFTSWSTCMELTPLLVQNIAYRLQRTVGITREMTSKMQWLLGHVKDMDVRYKVASELGLKDMVESLLQAPEVAYLKDTVWQRGFKR